MPCITITLPKEMAGLPDHQLEMFAGLVRTVASSATRLATRDIWVYVLVSSVSAPAVKFVIESLDKAERPSEWHQALAQACAGVTFVHGGKPLGSVVYTHIQDPNVGFFEIEPVS